MQRTKFSNVAGMFYPINSKELSETLETFKNKNKKTYTITTRAIIVPHAGYLYSGQLASEGFEYLDKNIKNIFIIAPSHHEALSQPVIADYDYFQTPLGNIPINKSINEELKTFFNCLFYNQAFEKEHSIEVQLPFLQHYYKDTDIKIIPILISYNLQNFVEKIIEKYYQDTNNAFIISSDLSHFHPDTEAKKIDAITAEMIEDVGTKNLHPLQACGSAGICAINSFSKKNNFSLIRIGLTNSSASTNDKSRVVGYGAWLLYEGKKNEFIKKYFSNYLINLCKISIQSKFNKKEVQLSNIPPVLNEKGASFVTLQINNKLRGCIGSIIAYQPLINDIVLHASDAAFNDTRFNPLSPDEFNQLSISISLLSTPEKIQFSDEANLMGKITPFKDGIIIKDKNHQAVYLPSVWEQLPNKYDFMSNLKIKAGLSPQWFSDSMEVFRFYTEYIRNN